MLENLEPPKPKSIYCKIQQIKETLETEDIKRLDSFLENTKLWSANTLSNQLRTVGIQVADTTITRHRNKLCACYRS